MIIIIIILARMETFYSSTCISTLLVFEFLISFLNVCIFTDYYYHYHYHYHYYYNYLILRFTSKHVSLAWHSCYPLLPLCF